MFLLPLLAATVTASNTTSLDWMAGSWRCEIWGGTFEETWSAPQGGTLQGYGRLIVDGKTSFMEFMSIEADKDGTPVMWMVLGAPSKGTKPAVPFRLTASGKLEATWENPKNDFPSKIHYRRDGTKLVCLISGTRNGKAASEQFDFRPVAP